MPTAESMSPPAHVQLIQMGSAYWVSKILFVAAKLGLADRLAAGPKSAGELAPALGAHAPSLHRLLRTLAGLGVLSERAEQRFTLTPLGEALKTGAAGSARSTLLSFGSDWMSDAFDQLLHAVQTGETGFAKAHGKPIFAYFAEHPEEASLFSETMVGFHGAEPPAVAESYDFSAIQTLVDVGGATGNLLAAVLGRHPEVRGVLFDLPHVIGEAPSLLAARGVSDRVTIQAGDFFESVPANGDAYLLSHIIHDWTEQQCLTILANVRRAMKPDSRLLIVEMVLPPGDEPHPGKVLDIGMLVLAGGQERTEAEYRPLLQKAGFQLTRVVPTASAVSILEAVPG
jgi:hypothetical protein